MTHFKRSIKFVLLIAIAGVMVTCLVSYFFKPTYSVTLDGEFIAEYNSIADAERKLGNNNTHIWDVCNGKRKKANGFIWKYKTSS